MYTLDELKRLNARYCADHLLIQEDVEAVNQMINLIETTRNDKTPQVGDGVDYINEWAEYCPHTHIESKNIDSLNVCEHPYLPFVYAKGQDGIVTSTSGGAWANIPSSLNYIGTRKKLFVIWGHDGASANGAIAFYANVNVWEYINGSHQFTTKTHDRFFLHILDKPDQDGDRILLSSNGCANNKAFRTEKDYQAWLTTFCGVESEDRKTVWTYQQKEVSLPLDKYLNLENVVIDSERCNGYVQECKRQYQGTSVTTFLPYQNERIVLHGEKEYMRAHHGF